MSLTVNSSRNYILSVWNNCIYSAKISDAGPLALWDYEWYGGDSLTMTPGSDHSMLALEGWNDREHPPFLGM